MVKQLGVLILVCVLSLSAGAQLQFDPVRMDPETDERFFFPTIQLTNDNRFYCTWASANVDWIGAYGQHIELNGTLTGPRDTLDIQDTGLVSCPPRVEYQTLSSGAWAKMIYHE